MASSVYFIQAASGPIKVGVAGDVIRRLENLQSATHEKLTVLATMPGGIAVERVCHERFASGRIRGEWFRADTEDLAATIAALLRDQLPEWLLPVAPPEIEAPIEWPCARCRWPMESERSERGERTCWACAKDSATA